MKLCSRCHQIFPIDYFHSNKAQPDGHANYCRTCAREYGRAWKAARRAERRLPTAAILEHVEQGPDCWLWLGRLGSSGYGKWSSAGIERTAHREVWRLLVGEIPDQMDLDHLCRNRLCVNPAHLEPVSRRENLLRGNTIPAMNAAKTHCPYGHPLDGVAKPTPSVRTPRRYCKECARQRARRVARAKRQAS